jgi:polysaccharide deacetylase 2 family uncharacterized protein YibQ
MTDKKRKRRGNTTGKSRTALAVAGIGMIMLLLVIILILLPKREQTDSGVTTNPVITEQDGKTGMTETYPGTTPEKKQEVFADTISVPERSGEKNVTGRGSISVVIDDVGNNIEELKPFLKFPGCITFAVLPLLRYSRESSRLIREAGKDVLLHLPMEAHNGTDPGPGAILASLDPGTIEATLNADLESVPGAIGVNNHMGSKATADIGVMEVVLSSLKEKGLFFLDSRTTPETRVKEAAKLTDIPLLERSIFLDNEKTIEAVRAQFEKGLKIAEETGNCVLIGHLQNKIVLDVLWEFLPLMEKMSYKLITLKELTGEHKTS